jgi:peptide deformylase
MWNPNKPKFIKHKTQILLNSARVGKFIHQIGEYDALRKPSKEVPISQIKSKDFRRKVAYLKKCLLNYRIITGYGRGITAVQVGTPERFSVIYTDSGLKVIINPKITSASQKLLSFDEGCMSASPIIVPTIRPSWIEFEYYDEDANLQKWNTKDDSAQNKMMNRVFQHEFAHMDGKINVDMVKDPSTIILESDPNFYDSAKFEEVLP